MSRQGGGPERDAELAALVGVFLAAIGEEVLRGEQAADAVHDEQLGVVLHRLLARQERVTVSVARLTNRSPRPPELLVCVGVRRPTTRPLATPHHTEHRGDALVSAQIVQHGPVQTTGDEAVVRDEGVTTRGANVGDQHVARLMLIDQIKSGAHPQRRRRRAKGPHRGAPRRAPRAIVVGQRPLHELKSATKCAQGRLRVESLLARAPT